MVNILMIKKGLFIKRYNTTMLSHSECDELLNIINCYTPSNTFEIFKYIREKRSEYDLEDDIEFIEKINSLRYFMAEDWSCSVNV